MAVHGPQQESGSGGRLAMKPRTSIVTRFPQQRSASIQTRLVSRRGVGMGQMGGVHNGPAAVDFHLAIVLGNGLGKVVRSASEVPGLFQTALQWGHDLPVMERITVNRKPAAITHALQWGHDLPVMERYEQEALFSQVRKLQWGHDLPVMESRKKARPADVTR